MIAFNYEVNFKSYFTLTHEGEGHINECNGCLEETFNSVMSPWKKRN